MDSGSLHELVTIYDLRGKPLAWKGHGTVFPCIDPPCHVGAHLYSHAKLACKIVQGNI